MKPFYSLHLLRPWHPPLGPTQPIRARARSKFPVFLGLAVSLGVLPPARSAEFQVTVDPAGNARVTERRSFNLKEGKNDLLWQPVSSQIDPASIQIRNPAAPEGFSMLSLRYENDLANRQVLLNRYLGKNITIVRRDSAGKEMERLVGALLSAEGGKASLVQTPDGDLHLDPGGEVILPAAAAENLPISPRLFFQIDSRLAGDQVLELVYLTRGISWTAAYMLYMDSAATKGNFVGWASIVNASSLSIPQASWRLLAEEVRKNDSLQPVEERAVFECRPPGLESPFPLAAGETVRLPLASASALPIEQRLVFDPIGSGPAAATPPQKLRVFGRVRNEGNNGPGILLPGGKVLLWREFPADSKGRPETFRPVTDITIPAVPIGKYFDLPLGDAAGVEGERRQSAFRQVAERVQEQDIEITLRNRTREACRAHAIEHPWGLYDIVQKSHEFTPYDDGSIEFSVPVPPGGKTTVTYRLRIKY